MFSTTFSLLAKSGSKIVSWLMEASFKTSICFGMTIDNLYFSWTRLCLHNLAAFFRTQNKCKHFLFLQLQFTFFKFLGCSCFILLFWQILVICIARVDRSHFLYQLFRTSLLHLWNCFAIFVFLIRVNSNDHYLPGFHDANL